MCIFINTIKVIIFIVRVVSKTPLQTIPLILPINWYFDKFNLITVRFEFVDEKRVLSDNYQFIASTSRIYLEVGWMSYFFFLNAQLVLLSMFFSLDTPCRGCWSVELFRTSSKKSWASTKRRVERWTSNFAESSRRQGRQTTKHQRCCTASEPLTVHSSWPAPPNETWCRIGERRVSCVTSTTDTCLLEDTPIDRQEDALTALYILQEVTL